MNKKRMARGTLIFFIYLFICKLTFAQSEAGTISGATEICVSTGGFISSPEPPAGDRIGNIIDWQTSMDFGTTWQPTGVTANTFPLPTQSTCYRVIVQNGSFAEDTSNMHCVTVFQLSEGGTTTGTGTVCTGDDVTVKLNSQVGNVVDWLASTNNGISFNSLGDANDSLVYQNITQETQFKAIVKSGLCPEDTSTAVEVSVSLSDGGDLSGGGTFCEISDNGTLQLNNYIGDSIKWFSRISASTPWTLEPSITNTLNYSNITTTTSYISTVKLGDCPYDSSNQIDIIIQNSVAGTIVNNDTTVPYNESNEIIVLQDFVGTIIDWIFVDEIDTVFTSTGTSGNNYNYQNLISNTSFKAVVQINSCIPDTSESVTVTVLPKALDDIPGLITPNADGFNDTWRIKGIRNFPNNTITIFNSDGSIVFSQNNYQNDWGGTFNGQSIPDGTYYYIIEIDDTQKFLFKGSLEVVRQ